MKKIIFICLFFFSINNGFTQSRNTGIYKFRAHYILVYTVKNNGMQDNYDSATDSTLIVFDRNKRKFTFYTEKIKTYTIYRTYAPAIYKGDTESNGIILHKMDCRDENGLKYTINFKIPPGNDYLINVTHNNIASEYSCSILAD